MKGLRLATKRLMDITISASGLVALSPILAAVALLVRATMGKPVLFRQRRPGKNEKLFTLYKFRTMTDARDPDGELLPDGDRLTRFGRFLRRWSLDELPQLWNVLKGHMSLVGPRPLLARYLPYYTHRERKRFVVSPGVTGLAQVSGRNLLQWSKRLELDARYAESWTLWQDVGILALTLRNVVSGRGFADAPGAIMKDLDEERSGSLEGGV